MKIFVKAALGRQVMKALNSVHLMDREFSRLGVELDRALAAGLRVEADALRVADALDEGAKRLVEAAARIRHKASGAPPHGAGSPVDER